MGAVLLSLSRETAVRIVSCASSIFTFSIPWRSPQCLQDALARTFTLSIASTSKSTGSCSRLRSTTWVDRAAISVLGRNGSRPCSPCGVQLIHKLVDASPQRATHRRDALQAHLRQEQQLLSIGSLE